MENLNQANEQLEKIKEARIIYIPPSTVASAHYVGPEPEGHASEMLNTFIHENKLWEIKPDIRHFGFNHPNPFDDSGIYGYEMWVTIPDDLEVPAPLKKKHFKGGTYAAHMIRMGNFYEWQLISDWVDNSPDYQFSGDPTDAAHMFGSLEETLNFIHHLQKSDSQDMASLQLDLLIPVKPTEK